MIHTGITGKYSFKSPFDVIDSDTLYISTSRTPIKEMEANGLDPLTTIYKPRKLENEFNVDYKNNVYIIGLQKVGGIETIYVPETYITGIPVNDGVKYVEKLLVFNLGLVPEDLDLDNLKETLASEVSSTIGLDVEVKDLNNSGVVVISKIDHLENLALRNDYLSNNKPYRDLYFEALDLLEEKNKIIELVNTGVKIAIKK